MSSKKSNSAHFISGQWISIYDGRQTYFGGTQLWFEKKRLKDYGCGIIAVANMVCCMEHNAKEGLISKDSYMEVASLLKQRYLFPLPKFGLNGWMLALGTMLFARRRGLTCRVRWGCLPHNMWKHMERMIADCIPVVLSIGPGMNPFGKKQMLSLYEREGADFVPVTQTRAHYVSVTGMNEQWLEVSSWGKRYYISKEEFREYVKKNSNYLFSNILVVT